MSTEVLPIEARDEPSVIQNAIDWNHPAAAHPVIVDADKAVIDWKGRTKFAICGFAGSSAGKAPFDDPEWIICGLNQLYRHITRADCWIDIHHYWADKSEMVDGTDHVKWSQEAPIPILMINREPGVPNSVRYPIEEIIGQVPNPKPWALDYLTSTIAFAIAFAIREEFKEIGLWGVDLIVGMEYFYQKSCAEFWLGVAAGLGIGIRLPNETALLKQHYRYGYQSEPDWGLIKQTTITKRADIYKAEHQRVLRTLYTLDGRIAVFEKLAMDQDLQEAATKKQELLSELHTLHGAIQACGYFNEFFELKLRGGIVGGE